MATTQPTASERLADIRRKQQRLREQDEQLRAQESEIAAQAEREQAEERRREVERIKIQAQSSVAAMRQERDEAEEAVTAALRLLLDATRKRDELAKGFQQAHKRAAHELWQSGVSESEIAQTIGKWKDGPTFVQAIKIKGRFDYALQRMADTHTLPMAPDSKHLVMIFDRGGN
jgi:chromosome segregation ATPase